MYAVLFSHVHPKVNEQRTAETARGAVPTAPSIQEHSGRGPPVLQGHTVRVLQLGHGCRAHPCGPLPHVGCTRSRVEVPHTPQRRGCAHVCAHEPEVLATWALPEGEEGALGPGSQPGSEASLGERVE